MSESLSGGWSEVESEALIAKLVAEHYERCRQEITDAYDEETLEIAREGMRADAKKLKEIVLEVAKKAALAESKNLKFSLYETIKAKHVDRVLDEYRSFYESTEPLFDETGTLMASDEVIGIIRPFEGVPPVWETFKKWIDLSQKDLDHLDLTLSSHKEMRKINIKLGVSVSACVVLAGVLLREILK